jgi:hypothetical protein
MATIRLMSSARRSATFVAILLLLTSIVAAKTNRVTIGTLTYLGTNQFGSAFRVTLDPRIVTSQPLSFANVTMRVEGTSQDSGAIVTPVTLLYIGGVGGALASCANGCASISIQLVSTDGKPFTFTLLNGEEFETFAVTTTLMRKPPGQRFIQPEQSVPIVLKRNASGKDCSPPCRK